MIQRRRLKGDPIRKEGPPCLGRWRGPDRAIDRVLSPVLASVRAGDAAGTCHIGRRPRRPVPRRGPATGTGVPPAGKARIARGPRTVPGNRTGKSHARPWHRTNRAPKLLTYRALNSIRNSRIRRVRLKLTIGRSCRYLDRCIHLASWHVEGAGEPALAVRADLDRCGDPVKCEIRRATEVRGRCGVIGGRKRHRDTAAPADALPIGGEVTDHRRVIGWRRG
jgi:hypothetical protein